jgi:hypothetical protein
MWLRGSFVGGRETGLTHCAIDWAGRLASFVLLEEDMVSLSAQLQSRRWASVLGEQYLKADASVSTMSGQYMPSSSFCLLYIIAQGPNSIGWSSGSNTGCKPQLHEPHQEAVRQSDWRPNTQTSLGLYEERPEWTWLRGA